MDTLLLDLRYAARALLRDPVFTLVSTISLALAIGVNSTLFSLVSAALFRPVPGARPSELVRVVATHRGARQFGPLSYREYEALGEAQTLSGVLAHQMRGVVVDFGLGASEETVEVVSGDYFRVLGVTPSRGRTFTEADLGSERSEVLVLSDRLWRNRLGGRSDIVGSEVRVNGRRFTVVGVAGPSFGGTFPGMRIGAWIPLAAGGVTAVGAAPQDNGGRNLMVMARLAPGVAASAATDEANSLVAAVADGASPDRVVALESANGVHPFIKTLVRAFLALLMGAVGVVLLVACANVANLVLARGESRVGELGVRAAVGATRWRIARQLVVESLVVGLLGGAGGVVLAFWSAGLLTRLTPTSSAPLGLDVGVDGRVLLFSVALSVATALGFGLFPALRASLVSPADVLRGGSGRAPRRGAAGRALVTAQVAFSTLLLVGSGLMVRGLARSGTLDPGVDPEGVTVMSASPELILGNDGSAVAAYWDAMEAGLARLPGVASVGVALYVPLGDRSDVMPMAAGEGGGEAPEARSTGYNVVRPGTFAALGIPLRRGRDFTRDDDAKAPAVVIVNEALADRDFGGEALGRTLNVGDENGDHRSVTVVGVVATTTVRTLGEAPTPFAYFPHGQVPRPDMVAFVRGAVGRAPSATALGDAARAVDERIPVRTRPMTEDMAFSLTPVRILVWVLGVAGGLALVLAWVGVFGVVSYTTQRRLPEMAIRMALGAGAGNVRRLVVSGGLRMTASGLAVGIVLATLASRLVRRFLFGLSPVDPVTFLAVAGLFFVAALVASYLPARTATGVDPAAILRRE